MKEASGSPRLDRLGRYYLVALCAIASSIILSQLLVQKFISDQENDSMVINIAGRQRMLSQRISKSALLIGGTASLDEKERRIIELKTALGEWQEAHTDLTRGNRVKGIESPGSRRLKELYEVIEIPYQSIVSHGLDLLSAVAPTQDETLPNLQPHINGIIENESAFVAGMDEVVLQYENEARAKVKSLRNIELLLLCLALGIIGLEIRYIFLPSVKKIRETFRQLSESEAKSKEMLREISSLYDSLELAYQDLLDVDVDVGEFVVIAKTSPDGEILFLSDKFQQTMEFDQHVPRHFFHWLEDHGYKQEDLQKIVTIVSAGSTWTGEVRTTNEWGDFVWWKMDLIPGLDENGQVDEILILGIDVTEKKEAESKSREINKEKIEKKVKEQQYRSVLILEGQEEERKRISRDLHDGIGQLLTAMKFNLEGVHKVQSAYEKEKLKTSKDLLLRVIREVRRVSFNLAPSALSDYGIVSVLMKFCREMTKISDVEVRFENQTGFISRLEAKVENNLYRIVQEAVNNAIKYSQASEIKVIMKHTSKYLHLEISDNGKGFDLEKLEKNDHFSNSGHGIFNIRERANFINATSEILTQPGEGTSISIDVPLD
jgi:signal transduction histidine kinase